MSRTARKLIAILLILWLPLVSGNALARAMAMTADHIQTEVMAECPDHAQTQSDCAQCEFCQVACAAYLPPAVLTLALQAIPRPTFEPFLGELHTLILPLLDPPPIAA